MGQWEALRGERERTQGVCELCRLALSLEVSLVGVRLAIASCSWFLPVGMVWGFYQNGDQVPPIV